VYLGSAYVCHYSPKCILGLPMCIPALPRCISGLPVCIPALPKCISGLPMCVTTLPKCTSWVCLCVSLFSLIVSRVCLCVSLLYLGVSRVCICVIVYPCCIHVLRSVAKFIVPDSVDKVASGIGLLYRPARLHIGSLGCQAGTTILCRSQLYPPDMDYEFGHLSAAVPFAL
jgi:hypothetical protein